MIFRSLGLRGCLVGREYFPRWRLFRGRQFQQKTGDRKRVGNDLFLLFDQQTRDGGGGRAAIENYRRTGRNVIGDEPRDLEFLVRLMLGPRDEIMIVQKSVGINE